MNDVDEFTKQFTKETIPSVKLQRNYFHVSDDILKMKSRIAMEPFAMGTYLGTGKPFKPSTALLDWLDKRTERFVILDKKSAWLFLCGRDAFEESMLKKAGDRGVVLVKNELGEVLGYGDITKDRRIPLKNLLDKGDFLRRERH